MGSLNNHIGGFRPRDVPEEGSNTSGSNTRLCAEDRRTIFGRCLEDLSWKYWLQIVPSSVLALFLVLFLVSCGTPGQGDTLPYSDSGRVEIQSNTLEAILSVCERSYHESKVFVPKNNEQLLKAYVRALQGVSECREVTGTVQEYLRETNRESN